MVGCQIAMQCYLTAFTLIILYAIFFPFIKPMLSCATNLPLASSIALILAYHFI